LVHISLLVFWLKAKNPRLPWQSRVLKIEFLELKFHSHDAKRTGVALANGHPAIDRCVLQHFCKRGFHFLTSKEETVFGRICQSYF
jgi:hypothetical protein